MVGVPVDLISSSDIRELIQHIFVLVEAINMYSASVEERSTLACFFKDQAIIWHSKYTI